MQRAAGINPPYVSKLDEFEHFIQHAKLSVLPMHSLSSKAQQPHLAKEKATQRTERVQHVLLIEDLPHCADTQQRLKLGELLSKFLSHKKAMHDRAQLLMHV